MRFLLLALVLVGCPPPKDVCSPTQLCGEQPLAPAPPKNAIETRNDQVIADLRAGRHEPPPAEEAAPPAAPAPDEPVPPAAAPPPAQEPAQDEPDSSGETVENGVRVIALKESAWCATSGEAAHACALRRADCLRVFGKSCTRTDAIACFAMTYRTRNTTQHPCMDRYGLCVGVRDGMARNPEMTDVSECFLARFKR